MSTLFAPLPPLPAVLEHPGSSGPGRRHRIDNFLLEQEDVDHFNQLLSRLGHPQQPLDCDCLVTAARELRGSNGQTPAACIRHRVRRGLAIGWMLDDPSWELPSDAAAVASEVTGYLRNPQDLIPDDLPKVGLLDDAIVVDTVWDRLAPEIASYLDFRRLRRVEAALRGINAFTFRREEWEKARRAEVALAAHKLAAREHSYVSGAPALFRIH